LHEFHYGQCTDKIPKQEFDNVNTDIPTFLSGIEGSKRVEVWAARYPSGSRGSALMAVFFVSIISA